MHLEFIVFRFIFLSLVTPNSPPVIKARTETPLLHFPPNASAKMRAGIPDSCFRCGPANVP